MRLRAPRPAGKCSSLRAARGAAGGKGVTWSEHGWEEAPAPLVTGSAALLRAESLFLSRRSDRCAGSLERDSQ